MKHLALVLCIGCVLALAGCDDNDFVSDFDDNGQADNGDMMEPGEVENDDLQTFVINNCDGVKPGDAVNINGASFPDSDVTDPAESVYTRNCLG